MRYCIVIYFLVCCSLKSNGQHTSVEHNQIIQLVNFEYENIEKSSRTINNEYLKILTNIILNNGQKKQTDSLALANIKVKDIFEDDIILYNLINGYYILNYKRENFESLKFFNEALQLSTSYQHAGLQKLSLKGIIELYLSQYSPNTQDHKSYLSKYEKHATTITDTVIVNFYKHKFNALDVNWPEAFGVSARKLIPYVDNSHLSNTLKAKLYDELSVYYRYKDVDSAIYYAEKVSEIPKTNYHKKLLFGSSLELAGLYAKKNEPSKASCFLEEAKAYYNNSDTLRSRLILNQFEALHVLKPLKEYEKAFYKLEKAYLDRAVLGYEDNKQKINNLNTQLKTVEKENQILIEKEQKKKIQYIAFTLGGLLFLGGIIAILINRNTKRKQYIAEQQREIEIQKTEKILKEQEITSINAMIEGQEKERQRVASDLHDSVGATLAAVKLQFKHIANNKHKATELGELFEKTEILLADAYNEVRSMAHIKNSGVIAKNGLLPAIKKLANNVSIEGNLQVDVKDFGLEERLENSLEITIFRIIQELITNIIKHANATMACINITQHEELLSIIIEDNGNGFNISEKLSHSNGMGLSSIEKRVEHLEGTMEVDSAPGRGTTILIDLPSTL